MKRSLMPGVVILEYCFLLMGHLAAAAAPRSAPGASTPPLVVLEALARALQDNYPMLEYAGWSDDWVREYRTKVATAPTRADAFQFMDEMVCRLNDYHTRFIWPERAQLALAPFRVEPVFTGGSDPKDHSFWETRPSLEMPPLDGVAIVVLDVRTTLGLQAGDEIVGVDGVLAGDALARTWPHSACSSAIGKLRSAALRMLAGPPGSDLHLSVRRRRVDGSEETISAIIKRANPPPENWISLREVEGVPVIRITRWTDAKDEKLVAQFDAFLDQCREKSGLIIDVRGNGGGQDNLAGEVVGRFLKQPVIGSISFHRTVPGITFERTVDLIHPRGPWRYEGRVAVLTDEGCMSACEHFVSAMAEAGALLCGTPTSGACGWIRPVDLPDGARLYVSQTFPLHSGGIPSPQLGIAPHIWAPRTLADVRTGTDTALRAALTWTKSRDRLPARLQPLAPFAR